MIEFERAEKSKIEEAAKADRERLLEVQQNEDQIRCALRQKQCELNQKDAQMFELQAEIARVKRESELRALEIKSYQEQLGNLKSDNIKTIQ